MDAPLRRLPSISLAGCRGSSSWASPAQAKRRWRLNSPATCACPASRGRIALGAELDPRPRRTLSPAADAATAHHRWVADGNYRAVRDLVWSRADTIIWLDYPLIVNLWRLTRRNIVRIATGAELYHGNRESFRTHFLSRDSLYLWALTKPPPTPKTLGRSLRWPRLPPPRHPPPALPRRNPPLARPRHQVVKLGVRIRQRVIYLSVQRFQPPSSRSLSPPPASPPLFSRCSRNASRTRCQWLRARRLSSWAKSCAL